MCPLAFMALVRDNNTIQLWVYSTRPWLFYALVKMKAALTDKSTRRFRNFCFVNRVWLIRAKTAWRIHAANSQRPCVLSLRDLCTVHIYTSTFYILQSIDHISTHITAHNTKAKAKRRHQDVCIMASVSLNMEMLWNKHGWKLKVIFVPQA